jgi:hypothetical protein
MYQSCRQTGDSLIEKVSASKEENLEPTEVS